MKKIEIKKGDRYNKITIIKEIKPKIIKNKKIRMVLCLCSCGKQFKTYINNIRTKHTTSCGCVSVKRIVDFIKNGGHYKKHGMSWSREYKSWNMMKQRCLNKKNDNYKKYGDLGIKLCKRWYEFENFYKDMGDRPAGTSIDRINNKGDYTLENCRWATLIEQNNNLSRNRVITYKNKTQSVASWARELKIVKASTIGGRLRRGWNPIQAIITPVFK